MEHVQVHAQSAARAVRLGALAAFAFVAVTGCDETADPSASSPPTMAPIEDYAANMQQCMAEFGWEVEVSWDGGVRGSVPREQHAQHMADKETCLERYGYRDRPPREYTYEEAAALYDELLDTAECVRELGFRVPEPPSRQAYAEHLAAGGLAQWHPHNEVAAGGRRQVAEACPHPS